MIHEKHHYNVLMKREKRNSRRKPLNPSRLLGIIDLINYQRLSNEKIFIIDFILVLVLGACTDDTEVEEETEEKTTEAVGQEENSGEINMSLLATPNSLDPHAANDQPSNHVNVNIYERLVEFTPELELEPGLAESYEQIEDTTWEFNIRRCSIS